MPTLEAMKKMIEFYHSKRIDMLKLSCTLPNLANICLHSSTNVKFYPFPEGNKDFLEKIRDDMVGGPSIVFTRKAVVGQTRIRSPSNTWKSIVGIDASQLYPYAMCQPMPTGLYTRWEFNADLQRFKPRSNKNRSFENMVWLSSRTRDRNVILRAFTQPEPSERLTALALIGFAVTVTQFLKLWVASITFPNVRKGNLVLQMKTLWRDKGKEKWTNYVDLTCGKKLLYHWDVGVSVEASHAPESWDKVFYQINIFYKRPLSFENLLSRIRKGELFGYVQCDLRVPENLREKFESFPPIFKNTFVSRSDIGDIMKKYAEENKLMTQPRRLLIYSFHLINGTIITLILNFYLDLGLECDRIYRFVQYSPTKCFNSFVQSAVDARRKGDENPHSSVVAETMKLLANSSYGYQIMDRSRHTITKYLNVIERTRLSTASFSKNLTIWMITCTRSNQWRQM